MSEDSVETKSVHPDWEGVRLRLRRSYPGFYELEAGGALLMDLGSEGWLLELTPDGRLLCQMGMDIEDIMSLMSEGTPEDLGTDEDIRLMRSEEHTSELQSRPHLVCRLLLEKKNTE